MHDAPILFTLAGGLAAALVLGAFTQRLGLSSLVGYMLAGVVVGPHTPGFVADARLASQMADIGVVLLMFGVGMHFHPEELLRVRRTAIPGAVMQSGLAAAAGWGCARLAGWDNGAAAMFGISLAIASTVVLTRMLLERDRLTSHEGHTAVGWLVVQDLFAVVVLVLMPALAAGGAEQASMTAAVALALAKAAALALLVWGLGTRLFAPLMERIARMRSAELFTLTVFVIAVGVAVLAAEVFGVSVALGAFLGGMVVGQSRFGAQAAADMAPFRDVFSALFFVSVGMLFNPDVVVKSPMLLLSALAVVLLVTPLTVLAAGALLRESLPVRLTLAVGLAQIGEFSFILAGLGLSLGVLPAEGLDAVVAVAIVTIALNPLLFRLLRRFERGLAAREDRVEPEREAPAHKVAVVIAGLGELGARVARRCAEAGTPACSVDREVEAIEELRARGIPALFGDPARAEVLRRAGAEQARVVLVADGTLAEKMQVCIAARQVNRRIAIVATAQSAAERVWLEEFGATLVYDVGQEAAEALFATVRRAV